MKTVAYMRVSTTSQTFSSQYYQIKRYGYNLLYKEKISSRESNRTQLRLALESLEPGDTFLVYKLDRIARNTRELLTILDSFEAKQINFVSLSDNIDTSTPMGKFFFTVMGAFSEMEAEFIRNRVKAGLVAAKANGKKLGRPELTTSVDAAISEYQTTNTSVCKIAQKYDISKSTLYRHIKLKNVSRGRAAC
ncbi:recombinase family protein [Culicoidibacter larvae]|uniref:Resolvase n=1 Tax=Culicoidibacter larvae TaxID=2579976 RepID=A0A5R8QDS7_9FIRM|nr:recombinase family protein [Culicoidibacter larvae]TLG75425.1 resolvase [Culicoidibacter larvae]